MGGAPKGLERVGKQRIVDAARAALSAVAAEIVISSNDDRARDWMAGTAVIRDRNPGTGGLAGVEAVLAWSGGDRDLLVVAWDMPFVNVCLFDLLLSRASDRDADAVVPASDSPHGFEPFCAYYSHRVLPALTRYISAGGGAAHTFLRSLAALEVVASDEIARCGEPKRLLMSVNTNEELEQARTILGDSR